MYTRKWDSVMSNILIVIGQVSYDLCVYVVSVNYDIFKMWLLCLNRFRPVGPVGGKMSCGQSVMAAELL